MSPPETTTVPSPCENQKIDYRQVEAHCRADLLKRPTNAEAVGKLARAHAERGDVLEAIRLRELAIYLNPMLIPVYVVLGREFYKLGRIRDAARVYARWLQVEPENAEARHMYAATSGQAVPSRATDEYVRDHFDDFASAFDDILLRQLQYRIPETIQTTLLEHIPNVERQLSILDAGCGTGLCGPLIRPLAKLLVGVDLSRGMLDKARERDAYDQLVLGELVMFMESNPERFDVTVSADVLIYFGELGDVFLATHRTLKASGFFIFTVEALLEHECDSYRLQAHGRYSHHEEYVRIVLMKAGFECLQLRAERIRFEMGKEVQGYLVVARKRDR